MNAAALGGLVEQWVWRCQTIVTLYQLGQPIDLKAEIERLIGQAELQAQSMEGQGHAFLARMESRLDLRANIAELPEALAPGKLADPLLNAAARAEALHALADAFGHAAQRLNAPE